jgi:hypothetical protein
MNMRSNRLGCFSGTGILAALITAVVIAGYVYARGGLLFSPGPLSAEGNQTLGGVTSHAEIGGECRACHTAPWESATMTDRCMVCHTEIAGQMENVSTLHGALFADNPGLACRHCHPEHRGSDAALTLMDNVAFPHEVVGFSLNAHQLTVARQPFNCNDCHHGDLTAFTLDSCDSCHRQMDLGFMTAHTLSFGSACLDCHDGVDRFDEQFNHDVFSFQLAGKHAGLACVQCHINARSLIDFPSTPQDCSSCHFNDEPHEGRFGSNCSLCHSVEGWTPAGFDHNLAAFKLEGRHAEVPCESCHINQQFRGTPMDCFSCHQQNDAHNGQFGTDCAACHRPTGWTPAEFNGQHIFPIHHGGGATCATCHPAGFTTYTCYSCHEHDEAEVRERHLDKEINNFQNCMECHPSGEKD